MQGSGESNPQNGLDGVLDHLVGPEASFEERVLVVGTAIALAAATVTRADSWSVLQYVVGGLVALDLGGGVIANATQSGKAWFHRAERSTLRRFAFVAGHVHPFALSVVFTPLDPLYGGVVYASILVAGGVILWVPRSLKRPVAFAAVVGIVILGTTLVETPPALGWFVPVFALKLLVGHLVPERPVGP